MKWLRRISIGVVLLAVLAMLAGVGLELKVKRDHPRNEAAFIQGLNTGITTDGKSVFKPVGHAFLIAEGDRACTWLRAQPYPWWRRGQEFSFTGLMARYRHSNPAWDGASRGLRRPGYRSFVIGQAWNDLCGDAWDLRKPRNPFNRPQSD
jgi:hypothetical protein